MEVKNIFSNSKFVTQDSGCFRGKNISCQSDCSDELQTVAHLRLLRLFVPVGFFSRFKTSNF